MTSSTCSAEALDPGNILGSLMGLVRVAVPTHAYVVKGRSRRATSRAASVRPCTWCACPARAARPARSGTRAGKARSARSRPRHRFDPARTRLCSSPWSGWRGYRLPSDLLHAYERGAELEDARRYDEALDRYYAALREDPMNIALRLQIGFLQEKLALFLDALATYESILEVARPGENTLEAVAPELTSGQPGPPTPDQLVIRRKRRDPLRRFYRSPARRDRDRILLVAQYRRAILLAGQELPRQWRQLADPSGPTRRDIQRRSCANSCADAHGALRERAHVEHRRGDHPLELCRLGRPAGREAASPAAAALARPVVPPRRSPGDGGCPVAEQVLAEPSAEDSEEKLWRLREQLARASLHELARLRTELGSLRLRGGDSLSRAAIDLSGLWIQQHLRVVLAHLTPNADASWAPDPKDLEDSIIRAEGGASRAGRSTTTRPASTRCRSARRGASPGPARVGDPGQPGGTAPRRGHGVRRQRLCGQPA